MSCEAELDEYEIVEIGPHRLAHGDCLEVMADMADQSVDMVLVDLPYGTTQNKWDSVIPLDVLWKHYHRICKPNAAMVFTAQTPFDKVLGVSNLKELKYEWIWEKGKATGHLNAKKMPMKAHENVLVFYRNQPIYNPQKTEGDPYKARPGFKNGTNYGKFEAVREDNEDGSRYPRSVQFFTHVNRPVHPTQKPVDLMEYLIRTYTNEGAVVLDNTMGSGTTGVACMNTGRVFRGIEKERDYFDIAVKRMLTECENKL